MTKDDDILAEARDRFKRAHEYEQEQRTVSEDDLNFLAGDQWPENIKKTRELDERPTLVVNRLPALVAQSVSAARRSNLSISVSAAEDGDTETADIIAGLIRQIERTSHADQAYDAGLEHAAGCGLGYWRVLTEYVDDTSFDQQICVERIRNPFAVYFDPDAKKYNKSDAKWVFVSDMVLRDELERQYPKADLSDFGDMEDELLWVEDDHIRVMEYFRISEEEYTIAALSTGETMELTQEIREALDATPDVQIVQSRKATRRRVEWYKLCGAAILERDKEFPSQFLPIVPCTGPEEIKDGRILYRSIIRYAKDPQRQYNYWMSSITEKIALAPKAPWLVTPRMIQGLEDQWAKANAENRAYLAYNPDGGAIPQRNDPPAVNAAEIQQAGQSIEDIKATTGIYDANVGAAQDSRIDESGIALIAKQQTGNEATFSWLDNLRRSVEHTGRIIVDMIPRIYDTPRMVRILGEDGAQKLVEINNKDPLTGNGIDLTTGRYDVAVSAGPAYATQRAAATAVLLQMMQLPQIAPVAAHMLAQQLDFPQAKQLGRYLKRSLPPGVLDEDDPDAPKQPQGPDPAQIAAKALADAELLKAGAQAEKFHADAMVAMASIPGEKADTAKTQAEAAKLAMELMATDGTLEIIIQQQVQAQILAMLQSAGPQQVM